MPVTVTYPGVYIEELSSGVRAITGVATSITAFIGRALRGPTDADPTSPVLIHSYGDFERIFGGLWTSSAMSFAVRDFYRNGGTDALIVRLFRAAATTDGYARLAVGALNLVAAQPGAWGNQLQVNVDYSTRPPPGANTGNDPDLFNLTVRDAGTGAVEVFRNVTHLPNRAETVDKVLLKDSQLVRVDGALPAARPPASASATDHTDVLPANAGDDGQELNDAAFNGAGTETAKRGLYNLLKADLVNLVCVPPYTAAGEIGTGVVADAATFCEQHRSFLVLDAPAAWRTKQDAVTAAANFTSSLGTGSRNAAVFFPRLQMANPLRDNQVETFAACGTIAGVFARTDAARGVWKAPAGLDATLAGVTQLSVPLSDRENGDLNPLGINCLRTLPGAGPVIWGSRTLRGADRLGDTDWKYIPVRRLALFLEESLYRGTQWAVFEPNDEPLWAQLRLNLGAFMQDLFRKGAFAGATPRDAYFVKCDRETTTQTDINNGIVNIQVGFAPLKPAEFVIIRIQQLAGQIAT